MTTQKRKTVYVPKEDWLRLENSKTIWYKTIGLYRELYIAPKHCPHTSWAERLYNPRFDNPAFIYVRRRVIQRQQTKELRTKIKFARLVVVVIVCILAASL